MTAQAACMQDERVRDRTEDDELFARIHGSDPADSLRALNSLVKRHEALVHWIARRFANMGVCHGDLVAEGTIGLVRAARKFDPERGVRFGTYAAHWIDRNIRRALDEQGQMIRIPSGTVDKVRRYRRVRDELRDELGREPADSELARALRVSEDRVRTLRRCDVAAYPFSSADSEADPKELAENYPDGDGASPERAVMEADSTELLDCLLGQLEARERDVVTRYFGLGADGPQTHASIAGLLGLSSERVRQIRIDAMRRLRRLSKPYESDLRLVCA